MALSDRQYMREQPGRGGRSAMRMLSVTTWLILICVGVYLIDAFLPATIVPTGRIWGDSLIQADPSIVEPGAQILQNPVLPTPRGLQQLEGIWQAMLERGTDRVIGYRQIYIMPLLQSYLHFSTAKGFLSLEWWRFIGFQFLHADTTHLLFNMLGLFFFGPMVEDYLGRKRYLAFYLLCGIFGAVMYLTLNLSGYIISDVLNSNLRIPFLLFNDPSVPLVGASAGIFGIIMAGAFMAPNAIVYVFFILPMRLRTVAYVLIAVALYVMLTEGPNAGGQAGHLGGALAGAYFIRHPHFLHGFFDILGRADPTSHHYRHGAGDTRTRSMPSAWRRPFKHASAARQAEVDRILLKIHEQGLHSLTESERQTLRQASERK